MHAGMAARAEQNYSAERSRGNVGGDEGDPGDSAEEETPGGCPEHACLVGCFLFTCLLRVVQCRLPQETVRTLSTVHACYENVLRGRGKSR